MSAVGTVQAVVFDLDETLFDHRESARRGIADLIAALGSEPRPGIIAAWENGAEELMRRRRAGEFGRESYRRRRVRALLADLSRTDGALCPAPADAGLDELYARYLRAYEDRWVAFPDAIPALREVRRRGLVAAILTNGPEERQQRKARRLGLDELVAGIWASDRLGVRKPDRLAYLTVSEALRCEPEQILHVGNDLEHDVHGAVAAGLRAVHLDRSRSTDPAHDRVNGLDEIFETGAFGR